MNKEYIINLLNKSDKAIARALLVINERQTEDEKTVLGTINANGRGFTPADAYMGTSMAQYFEKFGKLSEKQLAYWKNQMLKALPVYVNMPVNSSKYPYKKQDFKQKKTIEK